MRHSPFNSMQCLIGDQVRRRAWPVSCSPSLSCSSRTSCSATSITCHFPSLRLSLLSCAHHPLLALNMIVLFEVVSHSSLYLGITRWPFVWWTITTSCVSGSWTRLSSASPSSWPPSASSSSPPPVLAFFHYCLFLFIIIYIYILIAYTLDRFDEERSQVERLALFSQFTFLQFIIIIIRSIIIIILIIRRRRMK